MLGDRRGLRGLAQGVLGATLLVFATSACTPLIGGAVLLGLVGVGVLTSHCYDYLDVTVLDADGRKTCAATVTASKGGEHFELTSCYYAPLTDGHWTLRASLPGFPDALSTVEVEHEHDCTRHVQTVELTLSHSPSPKAVLLAAPAAPLPTTTSAPAAASALPSPEPAAPAPTPPSSALPANNATPPVGVFPDHETSH